MKNVNLYEICGDLQDFYNAFINPIAFANYFNENKIAKNVEDFNDEDLLAVRSRSVQPECTVEEWFFNNKDKQHEGYLSNLRICVNENCEKVERLNKVVKIMNKTSDATEFKRAYNEGIRLLYGAERLTIFKRSEFHPDHLKL